MTVVRRLVHSLLLSALILAVAGLAATAARADSALPYRDVRALGTIGLCDSTGHSLSAGNVADLPLASVVVSSQAALARYAGQGSKATLYAYQPRKEVDPGEWSGQQISGASTFSNPQHPMAAITTGDKRLSDFLAAFPAKWDGLVQLRIYLSAPNQPQYILKYPAANLKITGNTWTMVGPVSTVSCTVGKAVSVETLLLKPSSFPKPSLASERPTPTASASAASTAVSSPGSTTVAGGSSQPVAASTGSTDKTILIGLLAVAVILVGAGVVLYLRGRSRVEEAPQPQPVWK